MSTHSDGIVMIRSNQGGLSLIELMIGMTLGLVVLGALLYVFAGNRASYRHQESLSLVQESGRFGLELLARDIRSAGYAGCGHGVSLRDVTNPSLSASFDGITQVTLGADANTADSFTIRRGVINNDFIRVTGWAGDVLTVDAVGGLAPGGTLLLTDCVSLQRLRVRSVVGSNVSVNDENNVVNANILQGWTASSSLMTVVPVETVFYDVGNNALRRQGPGDAVPQPVAEGVINMKLLYGVDTAPSPYNHEALAYVANPANLSDVVSARVVLTIQDGQVTLQFPTTMTMRNRVADRP